MCVLRAVTKPSETPYATAVTAKTLLRCVQSYRRASDTADTQTAAGISHFFRYMLKVRSGGAAAPIFYIISSYPTTLNKYLRKDVNIDDIIGSATLQFLGQGEGERQDQVDVAC